MIYADRCDNSSLPTYSLTDFLFHKFASLSFLFTGVTYGFSVMVCCESPNAPFTILRTRFRESMIQFGKFKRLLSRVNFEETKRLWFLCKSGSGGVGTLEYVLLENHYKRCILLRVYTLPIIIAVNSWENRVHCSCGTQKIIPTRLAQDASDTTDYGI